jgi:zinc transport system substrate-binding protein
VTIRMALPMDMLKENRVNAVFRIIVAAVIIGVPVHAWAQNLLNIHVSILPQKYFVERIAGKRAVVTVLVKPGKSPATYAPSPDQIKQLLESDIFFRIGVSFENGFIQKIESIAGAMRVIDVRQGIALRDMKAHGHEKSAHGHIGKDPHFWMNPALVKIQAKTILEALTAIDPEGTGYYKENYNAFVGDLDTLNNTLTSVLKDLKGENLFVFHPSFGYFTDAYGLNQVAIETMGKAPKGKQLSAIIKLAKREKTRVIFVQPQFDQYTARKIASAIKGAVVSVDPLAYDYLAGMQVLATTISKTLTE